MPGIILGILLGILKGIGILLLVLLSLILILIFLILFVPIRYKAEISYAEKKANGNISVTWLLRLLACGIILTNNVPKLSFRIAWLRPGEKKQKAAKHKKKRKRRQSGKYRKNQNSKNNRPEKKTLSKKKVTEDFQAETLSDSSQTQEDRKLLEKTIEKKETAGLTEKKKTESAERIKTFETQAGKTAEAGEDRKNSEEKRKFEEGGGKSGEKQSDSEESRGKSAEKKKFEESRGKSAEKKKFEESRGKSAEKKKFEESQRKSGILKKIRDLYENAEKRAEHLRHLADRWNEWKAFLTEKKMQLSIQKAKRRIFRILHHIFPKKGNISLEVGFQDPSLTGILLAVLSVLYGKMKGHLQVTPHFDCQILTGEGNFQGRIRLGTICFHAGLIFLDRNIRACIKKVRNR